MVRANALHQPKYLLSLYQVPSTVAATRGLVVDKSDTAHYPWNLVTKPFREGIGAIHQVFLALCLLDTCQDHTFWPFYVWWGHVTCERRWSGSPSEESFISLPNVRCSCAVIKVQVSMAAAITILDHWVTSVSICASWPQSTCNTN